MKFKRGSGILLHISSLPSSFGIGDLGSEAYQFVDFLKSAGQMYWQILPLNPTDSVYGNSPYSSNSAFALNTLFINPLSLSKQTGIKTLSIKAFPGGQEKVNYRDVTSFKYEIFEQTFNDCQAKLEKDKGYLAFCQEHAFWLKDYALFNVLKEMFSGQEWSEWPDEFRDRNPGALKRVEKGYAFSIKKQMFFQYVICRQWLELKKYANQNRVRIIGDIPIYVNFDSADVWQHPELFKLDENKRPIVVAGVPPDYFSKTGQRWGNPVYLWDAHKKAKYEWWLARIRHNLSLFDCVRIDHFRGFVACWEIPSKEKTAVNGAWVNAPAQDFFNAVKEQIPQLPVVAEDLGIITPDVTAVMERLQFPGMKVLLFAFSGDPKTHPYMPENYTSNCVVYTGTHDNNTAGGWFVSDMSSEERKSLISYLGHEPKKETIGWELYEVAMKSVADVAIVPMQDILGLGEKARMNIPSTVNGNWSYRLSKSSLTPGLASKVKSLVSSTQRLA